MNNFGHIKGKPIKEYAEYANGAKHWYKYGKLHREDGPAKIYANGTKEWYKNGKKHRDDGPAVEWASGSKCWYLNGIVIFNYVYVAKINKLNKIYEKTLNEIFINSNKNDIIYLRYKLNLINIERFLNE